MTTFCQERKNIYLFAVEYGFTFVLYLQYISFIGERNNIVLYNISRSITSNAVTFHSPLHHHNEIILFHPNSDITTTSTIISVPPTVDVIGIYHGRFYYETSITLSSSHCCSYANSTTGKHPHIYYHSFVDGNIQSSSSFFFHDFYRVQHSG
jgi:hypothetical protein